MASPQDMHEHDHEEIFFDHLKDQFAFFYALAVLGMDMYNSARENYRPEADKAADNSQA